jgi:iron complex outermembrane receptor protein
MPALTGILGSALASAALAQSDVLNLPAIDVTSSRLIKGSADETAGRVSTPGQSAAPAAGTDAEASIGITGASTSVITAEEIARSPGSSLQDIIAREPGVQTWSTFGGVNGAGTTVDLRGFGASAASNTLVLINGRRLTDIDLAGVDFSAIPRDSIERIEITRGNSGAVLYGDGAEGGVINIVTKKGAGAPPSAQVSAGYGSFRQNEGNVAAQASSGPFATSVFGNAINSDGYRQNNRLQQRNAIGDLRYSGSDWTAYANIAADDQKLGLPGARRVTLTSSQLETDPTGATTPTAFANKQGVNGTLGYTKMLTNGLEMIIDGGVRQKKQQTFSSLSGFDTSDDRQLTTISFTPRFVGRGSVFGLPSKVLGGLDFYDADLDANRGAKLTDPPVHRYSLKQRSIGLYFQNTIGVAPNTDVSFGARGQQTRLSARDQFDPNAPNGAFDAGALPLDTSEFQHALHLGIEHRFNSHLALFGRVARSFRTPNVDERIGTLNFPVDFKLRTQTSHDMEAGARLNFGALQIVSSVYDMRLRDEIHFNPSVFANVNLDPTHRYGSETSATLRVSNNLTLNGGLAYTRSVFREGEFAGNDVPLVSRWTSTGAVSWNIWDRYLVFDGVVRYFSARRMDNDQKNFQPLIPGRTLVDVRLGGEYRNLFWSFAVQNLFDVRLFDYAAASATTFGTYNAYPQPGRTFLARIGVKMAPP